MLILNVTVNTDQIRIQRTRRTASSIVLTCTCTDILVVLKVIFVLKVLYSSQCDCLCYSVVASVMHVLYVVACCLGSSKTRSSDAFTAVPALAIKHVENATSVGSSASTGESNICGKVWDTYLHFTRFIRNISLENEQFLRSQIPKNMEIVENLFSWGVVEFWGRSIKEIVGISLSIGTALN